MKLSFPILYLEGMSIVGFQLFGFYCRCFGFRGARGFGVPGLGWIGV